MPRHSEVYEDSFKFWVEAPPPTEEIEVDVTVRCHPAWGAERGSPDDCDEWEISATFNNTDWPLTEADEERIKEEAQSRLESAMTDYQEYEKDY